MNINKKYLEINVDEFKFCVESGYFTAAEIAKKFNFKVRQIYNLCHRFKCNKKFKRSDIYKTEEHRNKLSISVKKSLNKKEVRDKISQKAKAAVTRRKYKNNREPGSYHHTIETINKIKKTNKETYSKENIKNTKWFETVSSSAWHKNLIEAKGYNYEDWLNIKKNKSEIQKYYENVINETNKQPIHELENFDKRGFLNFHLDHKFSIFEGYRNDISPEIIGNIVNLCFIPYKENVGKSYRCSITKEELITEYNKNK